MRRDPAALVRPFPSRPAGWDALSANEKFAQHLKRFCEWVDSMPPGALLALTPEEETPPLLRAARARAVAALRAQPGTSAQSDPSTKETGRELPLNRRGAA